MKLLSIQTGQVSSFTGATGKVFSSAIGKTSVVEPIKVSELGLEGDEQADKEVHGGVDKAVCAYASEHFSQWKEEMDLDLKAGAFGENLTFQGLVEDSVCLGDVYRIGSVLLEVSQPRQPCWKLGEKSHEPRLTVRVRETGKSGWYFRVLQEGTLSSDDPCTLEKRGDEAWTISEVNRAMYHRKLKEDALALSEHPHLSESVRVSFRARLKKMS